MLTSLGSMTDGITQVQAQVGSPARLSAMGAPGPQLSGCVHYGQPRYRSFTAPCWQLATDARESATAVLESLPQFRQVSPISPSRVTRISDAMRCGASDDPHPQR